MEFARPRTVDEALAVLADWPDAVLLAGGTDLMVEVNAGRIRPSRVVSLRKVDDLTELTPTRIGAGVTWGRLEAGPHRALAEAARTVGSPQIRNAGTLGGNLGTASPAGDGLCFLAAADAQVELTSAAGTRLLPWNQFLLGPKRTDRRPGELITAVHLPSRLPRRQAFAKVGIRQAMVIAAVSCVVMRDDDGSTRVALGAVGPTPLRARAAEEMISAEPRPSEAALAEFARLVAEAAQPITDHRSTASYRRHAVGVLARRCLERILEEAA
jgi:CO/xanthine dehydrogenase FAD-binding subunit